MSLYVQHGYGKANKISEAARYPGTVGVILSPGDEDEQSLSMTIGRALQDDLRVLIDPQTYVYGLSPGGSARKHAQNGIDFGSIHWSDDLRTIERRVSAVGNLGDRLGISGKMIAPSGLQYSFADVWTPLAFQYARTAADMWGPDRTIATIAIDEGALDDWSRVADWLDVATTLDVAGFYLLVARQRGTYPAAPWSGARLSNLLKLIYSLAIVNEYEVIWGYSDIEGLLGLAVGAQGIAAGWHNTLRSFTPAKWQPSLSQGGRPPAARYFLSNLLSPLRAEDEVSLLYRSRLREEVFTPVDRERFSAREFDSWTRPEAQSHHLAVLSEHAIRIVRLGAINDRVAYLRGLLSNASHLFATAKTAGIALPGLYQARVESFAESLDSFVREEYL